MNQDERIEQNKKKLEQRFGKVQRMGGKGTSRVVQKNKKTKQGTEDKNVKGLITKLGAQPLPDIQNINLFTEDGKVISLERPEVHGSFQNKTIICTGNEKTTPISECFADVISEIPPHQLANLKANNQIPQDALKNTQAEEKTEEKNQKFLS